MYDIILRSSIKNFKANRREPFGSVHMVITDQAGLPHAGGESTHLRDCADCVAAAEISPELNLAEWFDRVVKASTVNRIYQNLKSLENHIIAVARPWSYPPRSPFCLMNRCGLK